MTRVLKAECQKNATRHIEPVVFIGGPIMHAIMRGSYNGPLREAIELTIRTVESHGCHVRSAITEGYLSHGVSFEPGGFSEQTFRDHNGVVEACCYIGVWPSEGGVAMRSDGMCVEIGWATQSAVPCILIRDLSAKYSDIILGLNSVGKVQHLDYAEFLSDSRKLLTLLDVALA
ncbi:hypothetical protein [Pseudomonas gingeri]|jgi:hypothetical protein|uniref:Nucleoside 2-deoxyribosyltransferase n=1 Tax=Pseudomonas gingeri TaxID=117681 RepID=A0A7Y7WB16_9PSED|nr:hypothetical protein [Pseudomonas gingeri]NWB45861.1 hypothetical protein [Pseudomonas gingeri]